MVARAVNRVLAAEGVDGEEEDRGADRRGDPGRGRRVRGDQGPLNPRTAREMARADMTTAMAYAAFADAPVDIAVVEVTAIHEAAMRLFAEREMRFTSWARGWQDEDDREEGTVAGAVDWSEGTRMGELLEAVSMPSGGATVPVLTAAERDRALEQLWLDLVTCCDGSLAVPPLALLGMHAWSQGNGALALVAAERALSIDPGYRLARLLDQTLYLGVRPGGTRAGSLVADGPDIS